LKLEEILDAWKIDAKIDEAAVDKESLAIPQLHHKYLKMFTRENLLLKKMRATHDQLVLNKQEYYSGRMCQEDLDTFGWHPFPHRVIKQDIPRYLDGDDEIIASRLKNDYQREKVDAIKSIMSTINNRSFHINNFINWQKFLSGI